MQCDRFFNDNWRQAHAWMMLFVGRLRWTVLHKERYGKSLIGRGSNLSIEKGFRVLLRFDFGDR